MRALVTGASRGIGSGIARQLVAAGWQVLAPSRAQLDLGDHDAIRRYCAQLDDELGDARLDALVHSAGVNWPKAIADVDHATWSLTLQVNVGATMQLVQGLQPRLVGARVVALGSILGIVGRPKRAAYSTSKAALAGLVRALAVELGPQQTLVNALCPGYIDTDLTRANNTPEQLAAIASTIPLGRLGRVDEIAALATWLCSPANSYMTGQSLVIDGGFTCQ
ncbi:MAG TPA: SDR family oxidoreductase [Myxococcota bacterium]